MSGGNPKLSSRHALTHEVKVVLTEAATVRRNVKECVKQDAAVVQVLPRPVARFSSGSSSSNSVIVGCRVGTRKVDIPSMKQDAGYNTTLSLSSLGRPRPLPH
jgi:hypothetical protein